MRATEVFKPQGTPIHTLVREPVAVESVQDFDDAIEETGKLVRVVGPSKSGKTVFVATKAQDRDLIRVSASGINSGADLWNRVLASAGAEAQRTTSVELGGTVGGEAGGKGSAGVIFAKVETEGKVKADVSAKRTTASTQASDPLQAVVQLLARQEVWVFIDDFHYATPDVQTQLAEQIKFAAEEGVQLIIALIPGRSEDILRRNTDLQGRIVDIPFTYWNIDDLSEIAEHGFPFLGVRLEPGSAQLLAKEAAGTPQLMQALCLELARELGARETLDPPQHFEMGADKVATICTKLASNRADFSSTIDQMRKGPPTRGTSRKSYPDTNGKVRDVYELLIAAFGMDPPQLTFTYDELQKRVDQLAGADVASVWESVRHMSDIANNMSAEKKLDFAGDLRWVSILDPYLFFALRWG
ncbi:hypothetical protein [Pseudomonas sp. BN411]|uniref:hypothetical protein n=1 Tax=Pseudomonas sp. BN411 TaxID=2567887 RepID=UPI0024568B21|nr:hypothetical protein [Pseudomonas sp. BN411]MDH4559556.1 hypothetical protein [Pseudomonas sp. BN411]